VPGKVGVPTGGDEGVDEDSSKDEPQLSEEERREVEREARLLFDVDDEIVLEYEVHPLVSRPSTTTRLAILVIVAYTGAYFLFGPVGVLLSVFFTIFPAAPYIFPTRYVLTRRGIHLINWIARDKNRWSTFDGYEVYPDAVQLYFNRRSLRGWILRGNILYFNEDEETQQHIVDVLSTYLDPVDSE